MTGVVFSETQRRSWRSMLYWALGIGVAVFLQIVAIPDVESLRRITELLQTLPPVLLQALGASDMEFLATTEGYLAVNWFGIGVLAFCAYAAVVGLNVTANDEERGVLDLVLAAPVPRWRLVFEKALAYALLAAILVAIVYVFTYVAIIVTPSMQVDMTAIVNAQINMLPSTLLTLGVAVLLAGAIRRRGTVVGLLVLFLVGSYFLDTLGRAVAGSPLENLRWLSFLRFYDAADVMQHGLNAGSAALLIGLGVGFTAIGGALFQRRDVGR